MFDSNTAFSISKDSLVAMVEKMISETDGASLVPIAENKLLSKISPRLVRHCVKINFKNGVIEVFASINMKRGCVVAAVCESMQNNIKKTIQDMTSAVVSKVSITLVDCIS
ncbi:MAG: Asp23/Gls24 family envelope stress response protein [Ruminococcus sp.]|nr:Asp23/Gls24 family envelope stress response protein [Ruminococcus sp.]